MISSAEKDLENNFYNTLKDTDVASQMIADYYPRQSIPELAGLLAKGMGQCKPGDVAAMLEKINPKSNYHAVCVAAFERAMIRLLNEAVGKEQDNG